MSQNFIDNVSPDAVDFIECCSKFNPKQRLNASQLLKHPWIVKNMIVNNDVIDEETEGKVLTSIVVYSRSSKFIKIIISIALGLNLETEL